MTGGSSISVYYIACPDNKRIASRFDGIEKQLRSSTDWIEQHLGLVRKDVEISKQYVDVKVIDAKAAVSFLGNWPCYCRSYCPVFFFSYVPLRRRIYDSVHLRKGAVSRIDYIPVIYIVLRYTLSLRAFKIHSFRIRLYLFRLCQVALPRQSYTTKHIFRVRLHHKMLTL
jgi:hypothetical protein